MHLQATGDTKSPACFAFSRTEDPAERYSKFAEEIEARPFGFYGPRDRILKRLATYAPAKVQLQQHQQQLLQQGLRAAAVPAAFKEKLLDLVAFLCCLSRQAADVKWSKEQIQKWEALGLDVQEELSKKEAPQPAPSPPPPGAAPAAAAAPSEVAETGGPMDHCGAASAHFAAASFGVAEVLLLLPSGQRASLHLQPSKNPLVVHLPRPVDHCSLEDVRGALLQQQQQQQIQERVLENAQKAELPEARTVDKWNLKDLKVEATLQQIIEKAKDKQVVPISKETPGAVAVPIIPAKPVEEKPAPSQVRLGLARALLTLPSGGRAALHFEPTSGPLVVHLSGPVDQWSLEAVRQQLLQQQAAIQKSLLEASSKSELHEARSVNKWNLKEINVLADLNKIIESAKADTVVPFTVTGKCSSSTTSSSGSSSSSSSSSRCDRSSKALPPVPPVAPKEKEPEEEEEKKKTFIPPEPEKAEADCEEFPLNLEVPSTSVREQTVAHLVSFLNSSSSSDSSSSSSSSSRLVSVGAACLAWALNATVFEMLQGALSRSWGAPQVVEGAPTAADWVALQLQTALDTKAIKGNNKETNKSVIKASRICIDAARVAGRLLGQRRRDKPEAPLAGPGNLLGTALGLSFDGELLLGERAAQFAAARCSGEAAAAKAALWPLAQVLLMSLLLHYQAAASCQVYVHHSARYVLPLLALPQKQQIQDFLHFVEIYNELIQKYKTDEHKNKTTMHQFAQRCEVLHLDTGATRLPQSMGETELLISPQMENIIKVIKG
ncbi:hypothetical protein, conserved [Eimeria tenella]|uniref:Uncharacterized protein n=1 Tax=Eimeria tenella TaxID=5802 RepID=U6KPS1_EIMTE|nr:hypothetical protein, conserved [Eimeria tenella]CDJ38297.1 hypothetical protein, conserved [Eimeria tenella]|eukprot:XP_013229135.1 hypothetical protein, conserved [Eimeria tenella]